MNHLKDIKITILNGKWTVQLDREQSGGWCAFPRRVIMIGTDPSMTKEMLKHNITHEITHAMQAELGQWQNVIRNGKSDDSFDSEFIAEFMAIHGEYILKLSKSLLKEIIAVK